MAKPSAGLARRRGGRLGEHAGGDGQPRRAGPAAGRRASRAPRARRRPGRRTSRRPAGCRCATGSSSEVADAAIADAADGAPVASITYSGTLTRLPNSGKPPCHPTAADPDRMLPDGTDPHRQASRRRRRLPRRSRRRARTSAATTCSARGSARPPAGLAATELTRAGPALDALLARAIERTRQRAGRHRRHAAGRELRVRARAARGRHAAVRHADPRDGARRGAPAVRRRRRDDHRRRLRRRRLRRGRRPVRGRPVARRRCPTRHALLAQLHAELQAHLEPLLAALAAATGRPLRALWRSAGDRLGGAFLWLGEVVGMRERAWDLGTRCMQADGPARRRRRLSRPRARRDRRADAQPPQLLSHLPRAGQRHVLHLPADERGGSAASGSAARARSTRLTFGVRTP